MKNFLLILTILSSNLFAQYTTPNTGVNWNLDSLVLYSSGVVIGTFPNYQINNNIIIAANDELNILPGSNVTFTTAAAGIEVNGIFKAVGSPVDSIVFTSTVEDSTGYYVGFRFNANPNSNLSQIKYARIFYADYGFRCIDASPTLSNSYLYKCGRGVQLSSSNAVIKDNVIERSYEYGITMTLSSSPLIEGNHLIKNNTKATSAMNQISIGLQGNNSPIIRNNIIEGGESIPTGGISLWVSGSTAFSNAVIEGNQIFNNSFGITLYSTSNGIINAIVRDNIIYNNNINPNVMTSGSGINVNGSPANQPIITRNTIYGNWWGITIQNGTTVQAGPQPNIGNIENSDTTDDGMNIIYGNIQGSNVYDLYNNCTNDIYAQNNDWGVYDSLSIENHIFHKADNSLHGLVRFIPFSASIPVELTSFTAELDGNTVQLNWSTSTEKNNLGFEIERSVISNDVRNLIWMKIGFVEGKGTTTEPQNYSFNHEVLKTGTYLYRLKQIDFTGTFQYSKEVKVEIISPNEFVLEQNYPNPFNPSTKISWQSPVSGHQTLKIFDVLGNEVATLFDEYREAGRYEVEFNVAQVSRPEISSGLYMYKLTVGNFSAIRKMMLIR
ncbi:MAG: right-handed parallel beta-helix repeat-containing protein [Ignavibacterium sp.]|nr:right-handed parallel beta-helix repeat-containing protein [Ignavibacterium sp.]